ncbi:MAG TPA: hypothetical protein PKL04_00625 [Methanofastidiosum sp.]|nr:hypothetical protein [Methanofastidiosum sp.]
MDSYNFLVKARAMLLIATAELLEYQSWAAKFKVSNVIEMKERIISKNELPFIDNLTKEQAFSLGFQTWGSDNKFLIPLYLKPFINPQQKCTSILETSSTLGAADNDHRFGMMGYYIVIK